MSFFIATKNRQGIALLNIIFVFIFIGVLITSGMKMYGSIATRGKINDTKGILENQVRVIVAWGVKNGHLPTSSEYAGGFGGTAPLDAWGKQISYVFNDTLAAAATGGLCGRTGTALQDSGVSMAFALISGGDDFSFQTTVTGTVITAPTTAVTGAAPQILANYQSDIYRTVPLEEMKNMAGCYGTTGGRLRIVNNELPNACSGSTTYQATLFADGGVPGYTWTLTTSPSWVSVNAVTGAVTPGTSISGTTRSYPITVTLTDAAANSVQRNYNLSVVSCSSGTIQPSVSQEFIHGSTLSFSGNSVSGANATIVLTGNLQKNDLNGGANIAVTNAYIGGNVALGGSQSLGSPTTPGIIYINGDLDLSGSSAIYGTAIYVTGNITLQGSPYLGVADNSAKIYALGNGNLLNGDIHGNLYVGANLNVKNATFYMNAYVSGNLTLDWTPTLSDGTTLYYKQTVSAPGNFDAAILAKCIKDAALPPVAIPVTMPATTIPPLKADSWYTGNGYVTSGALVNDVKMFSSGAYSSNGSASNVVIVSKGDVTIGSGNDTVSGVIYAPNGRVSFGGSSFTGYVIAKNGFYVTSGGSTVTLKPLSTYIPSSVNYPFVYP